MPIIRIPITLSWTSASGSPGVNVWHGRADAGVGFDDGVQSLVDMLNDFYLDLQGLFPAAVKVQALGEAFGVGPDDGSLYTYDSWGLDGSGGGDFLPPANAMYINWRTPSGGRRGRGRTFLGPMSAGVLEANGTPDETDRTTVQTAVDTLIANSTGLGNGALGVWSRTDELFRDFVAGDVPNKFASIRSRRD